MKAGISLARAVNVRHYVGAGGCPACGVCTSQMFVKACICTATADSISHRLVIADRGPASAVGLLQNS